MTLYWWDIRLHTLSDTQVDSTKSEPNENAVFGEIVMCRRGFTNSSKCPALTEGGDGGEGDT